LVGAVEEFVYEALSSSEACRRTASAFERSHELGVTTLKFYPQESADERWNILSIAEIKTTFSSETLGKLDQATVQTINGRSVFGLFAIEREKLCMYTQVSLFREDADSQFLAVLILRTFWDQLAGGYATVQSVLAPASTEDARAWLNFPHEWSTPVIEEDVNNTLTTLRQYGYVGSKGDDGFVFEVVLSGESPTRMMDPTADTALVSVRTGVRHPVAGIGFYGTIAFPLAPAAGTAPAIAERLNSLELRLEGFPPRAGAWGCREGGREVVYNIFVPAGDLPLRLHQTLASWLVQRAKWIAEHHWGHTGFELFAGELLC
jgi:hypothetical protein